jgi:hypothetical protein
MLKRILVALSGSSPARWLVLAIALAVAACFAVFVARHLQSTQTSMI